MISEDIKKQLREKYICTGCWGNDTFAEMLKKISEQYGTKIAAKDEQMEISFRQWNELAEQYAVFFYQEGLREGDKVVLQLPNSVMFLIICFAMFKLGVVPVLALPAHREHEISAFIEKTNAKAYIVPKRHLGYDYTEKQCQILLVNGGHYCMEENQMQLVELIENLERKMAL